MHAVEGGEGIEDSLGGSRKDDILSVLRGVEVPEEDV